MSDSFNDFLRRRNLEIRGSSKWREFDRASLLVQMNNQVRLNVRRQPSREDFIKMRASRWLDDYEKRQSESWRARDVRRVRDDLRGLWGL